jgi:hypothetical protein
MNRKKLNLSTEAMCALSSAQYNYYSLHDTFLFTSISAVDNQIKNSKSFETDYFRNRKFLHLSTNNIKEKQ